MSGYEPGTTLLLHAPRCESYNRPMLNTPLTKLRKAAAGSLTAQKIEAFMRKRRFPRSFRTIGAFERGQYKEPHPRFVELYAECIGQPVEVVYGALRRTQRLRAKGPK